MKSGRFQKAQILVLHSSSGASWMREREGILKFSKSENWRIHVVDHLLQRLDIEELIDFWRPDGIIAECGSDAGGAFSPKTFGRIPVVYLAGDVSKLSEEPLFPIFCKQMKKTSLMQFATGLVLGIVYNSHF